MGDFEYNFVNGALYYKAQQLFECSKFVGYYGFRSVDLVIYECDSRC